MLKNGFRILMGLLAGLVAPGYATVLITSMTPSSPSPQLIGSSITWTVEATDSNPGPLAFRFNVEPPGGAMALVKNFNVGNLTGGIWKAQPFLWFPTGIEGVYRIEVIIRDFTSGETDSETLTYTIKPLASGKTPVVAMTGNPLVALFNAPSCPAGSTMRVVFQEQSRATPGDATNYADCHPPNTMTFEIAGMYPNTTYNLHSQTNTAGTIADGPAVTFTTGSLPTDIPFPGFAVNVPPDINTEGRMLLLDPFYVAPSPFYATVATDLSGNILWYYYASPAQTINLTRLLPGGTLLTVQSGPAWSTTEYWQLLRQIDLAGNIVHETNIGIVARELLAMGAADGGPCSAVARPAKVGDACLGTFNHDAIQTLPNGYTAVIASLEKIFPPGTQGDTSGLPVDIVGDMIIVLDTNWQVAWYFDAFEHAGGAPELDINRPAVLNESCIKGECAAFLLGAGIAPTARDWLHGNSLYYWPRTGDLVWSSRHQDWVMKIDYSSRTGDILWRLGPCGDFTFSNQYNDPWPWFSHQHEVGIEGNGAGPVSLFDNGNTRVSPPTGRRSSSGCIPGAGGGDSRGMALTLDENTMQVSPILSVDLGVYSSGLGSAQLLSNGNYFFLAGATSTGHGTQSYSIEILPTPGTATGTQVLNIQNTTAAYRAWMLSSLYDPPTT
ncbi:MAG TPA: aryl-sulfate sulfotransferase [Bryobacteraceae bacterium]|nr:aryl-sulfate sulfotransferase [Bryobacteraceae bacterium]